MSSTAFDWSSLDVFGGNSQLSPIPTVDLVQPVNVPSYSDITYDVPSTSVFNNPITPIAVSGASQVGANVASPSWDNILAQAFNTGVNKIAAPILNAQYGGPQPGQYFSTNPKTGQSTAYALPQGSTQLGLTSFPGTTSTGSNLLLYLGMAGVALLFFMKSGK